LSGGETFLASLSLALGLADTVQRRNGGIRIDCLFVDEGFGALDTEALDLAIDTLAELRAGGRTVGVISHVEGVKQSLDLGLHLDKTDSGSRIYSGREWGSR
jgi:exonuclease SbcC